MTALDYNVTDLKFKDGDVVLIHGKYKGYVTVCRKIYYPYSYEKDRWITFYQVNFIIPGTKLVADQFVTQDFRDFELSIIR